MKNKINIEIDVDDYLSKEEKKELCIGYIKETLRGSENHKERVLSNMAYNAAEYLLDFALTKEQKNKIKNNIEKQIKELYGVSLFRKKDAWGSEDSEAYLEVKKSVLKHKHLIDDLVKKAITERDYTKELEDNADYIGECIVEAIKKGLRER